MRGGKVPQMHRRGKRLAVVAVSAATSLAGCGSSGQSTGTSVQLSQMQYDNAQTIKAFVLAMMQAEKPESKPPTEPTNYAKADAELQGTLRELQAIVPPAPMRAAYTKVLEGTRHEIAHTPAFEQAQTEHNALLLNQVEARNTTDEQEVRAGLTELDAVLQRCEGNRFAC